DKQTAYQVSNAILDIQDVMKVVITHSLEENLLNRFDEIIVLKAGEVAEKGTFEELMKKKEYFYSLYMVAQ
ncbi:MAG: ABC transporter ATP-binding protein, partial [Lachnospiraceae bacterium]|nr:ABC transporter ATP-binding protein [Lachnospiraceae bacterium]